ncbi:MAG TPA: UbiH/UbiF/VisC/COQ6 family ubiquinone biosynthesis hydroxylase [Micropepsaceae bacterium]|nr:UbiH/UbiF/VisC/COQ6 family ubiquinone biosynthesis hydroxylase [Micropepsaceae bacterium]
MSVVKSDIAIAGGGMAGMTLALAFAKAGLSVCLVDRLSPAEMSSEAFDGRVSALAYSSVRMMRALDLWRLMETHAQPITQILVNEGRRNGHALPFSLHFDHHEIGEPLGHIVENRHIRQALLAAIAGQPNLRFMSGVAVNRLTVGEQDAVIELSSGTDIVAKLVVAAEGRDCALRDAQGIGTVAWDYDQLGLVTTVEHEYPHGGVAYEQFLPTGPFAILPMTGNRSSLVWTENTSEARRILSLPSAGFAAELAASFGAHLGEIAATGPVWSYPLKLQLARSYVKHRFALVGDAAHTIHPLAGQGFNLGLKDVAALAECVLDAARLGTDYGDEIVLRRYERWRRFDSTLLAAVTDSMNRLFSNDILPLRLVRDLGLGIVDQIAPLRRILMRHAGGDLGTLPRLLRGEPA